MQYTLILSALVALVAAADRPSFLNDKFQITEGENFTFKFNNCQGGCTIILKTGNSGNLKDVKTITSGATGESFTWTPSGLPSGTYAFYIKNNGNGLDNYSKQFTYSGTGASTTEASSTASETASSTEASSTTASSTASSTTASSTTMSKTTSAASTTSAPSTTTSQSSTSTRSTTSASTTVPNGGARATPMALVAGAVAALAYLG